MTELYIDGVSVPLPSEFEITVKQENPFFTKNGEYTYDIELSLYDPVVAKLYGFLNRLNKSDSISMNRKAVLIADNRVYINGTEIITGWSESVVQVQLVSGNSQLNFFVGSEKLISELEGLPETNPCVLVDGKYKPSSLHNTDKYPDIDYCTPTVFDSTNNEYLNNWLLKVRYTTDGAPVHFVDYEDGNPAKWAPMPYLCAFIKAIISSLGYKLTYNAIEETGWAQLCILHVARTHKWAEILPQWTVKEFLEGIETFFNATFVINKKTSEVRLVFNNQYFQGAKVAYVSNVIDEFNVECDFDDRESYDKATLSYPQSGTTYGKLRSLPDVVIGNAKKEGIIGMTADMFFSIESNRKTDTIFSFTAHARDAIFTGMSGDRPTYEFVNQFAPVERDSSEVLEMVLQPVELSHERVIEYQDGKKFSLFFPSIGGDNTDIDSGDGSIMDMINNSGTDSKSKPNLYIGFFLGYNHFQLGTLSPGSYPVVMVDRYVHSSYGESECTEIKDTLLLGYMSNKLYNKTYDIDYQNPVEFTSYDENLFDTNSVFVINNKRYICEYIEYKINESGRAGAWTGKFYPIKISDTETYQRWILSDGKWRDGGVWLDNGRWLDN